MNSLPARRPDVSRSLLIWQKDSSVNSHINVMFARCRITHSIFFRYTSQLLLTETRFSTEFGNSSLSYLDPNYPTQILLDIRLSFLQVPYQNTFYTAKAYSYLSVLQAYRERLWVTLIQHSGLSLLTMCALTNVCINHCRLQWSSSSMPDCSARGPGIDSRSEQLCLS